MYTFSGYYNSPTDWGLRVTVPDGQTVTNGDFIGQVLVPATAQLYFKASERMLTESEEKAAAVARSLPDGWEPTADGINVEMMIGGPTSHSRTYQKDGRTVKAPCDAAGGNLPATREALLAAEVSA